MFEMGTGVSPPLKSPGYRARQWRRFCRCVDEMAIFACRMILGHIATAMDRVAAKTAYIIPFEANPRRFPDRAYPRPPSAVSS